MLKLIILREPVVINFLFLEQLVPFPNGLTLFNNQQFIIKVAIEYYLLSL